MSSAFRGQSITWRQALRFTGIDCGLWALLTPLIFWGAKKFPFETGLRIRATALHLVAAVVVAYGELRLFSLLLPFAYGSSQNGSVSSTVIFRNILPSNFHTAVLTYLAIVSVAHGLDYYQRYRDREMRATQFEARLAEAQLLVLRMQLHPHFLFNTLHSISALVYEDPEAADSMLTQLADLLRMTLTADPKQEVALREELDFLSRYLEIEKTRLGERLQVTRAISPETLDAYVPHLILQPLVENAIRHSIAPRAEGGRVEIRAIRTLNTLRMEIWDDGPGLKSSETIQNVNGLGLANTRARLAQLYGSRAMFELSTVPTGGFLAALTIPFRSDMFSRRDAR